MIDERDNVLKFSRFIGSFLLSLVTIHFHSDDYNLCFLYGFGTCVFEILFDSYVSRIRHQLCTSLVMTLRNLIHIGCSLVFVCHVTFAYEYPIMIKMANCWGIEEDAFLKMNLVVLNWVVVSFLHTVVIVQVTVHDKVSCIEKCCLLDFFLRMLALECDRNIYSHYYWSSLASSGKIFAFSLRTVSQAFYPPSAKTFCIAARNILIWIDLVLLSKLAKMWQEISQWCMRKDSTWTASIQAVMTASVDSMPQSTNDVMNHFSSMVRKHWPNFH